MNLLPRYPRTLNRVWACVFGYFWLSCSYPDCGRMFGGHEWGGRSSGGIADRDPAVLVVHGTCWKHPYQYDANGIRREW